MKLDSNYFKEILPGIFIGLLISVLLYKQSLDYARETTVEFVGGYLLIPLFLSIGTFTGGIFSRNIKNSIIQAVITFLGSIITFSLLSSISIFITLGVFFDKSTFNLFLVPPIITSILGYFTKRMLLIPIGGLMKITGVNGPKVTISQQLGFGGELESFTKLVAFARNPIRSFEENIDDNESSLRMMSLNVRLFIVLQVLVAIAFTVLMGVNLMWSSAVYLGIFILLILLSYRLAKAGLWIGSALLNFSAKIITKKDDVIAAKRVIAYSSILMPVAAIPIIGLLSIIPTAVLLIIGVSKQYKISYAKGFTVSILPIMFILTQLILSLLF